MVLNKNKEKITKEFLKGHIDEIQVIIPNIADKSLTQIDKDYKLDEIINEVIDIKRHGDSIETCIFIYSLLSAKLKRLFSITESTFSLTSVDLLKKFNINIHEKKELMSEGNMRNFINRVSQSDEITDEQIKEKIKELKKKDKESIIDKEKIKNDLQIKQNGHKWIEFFNNVMKKKLLKFQLKILINLIPIF